MHNVLAAAAPAFSSPGRIQSPLDKCSKQVPPRIRTRRTSRGQRNGNENGRKILGEFAFPKFFGNRSRNRGNCNGGTLTLIGGGFCQSSCSLGPRWRPRSMKSDKMKTLLRARRTAYYIHKTTHEEHSVISATQAKFLQIFKKLLQRFTSETRSMYSQTL